MKLVSIPSSPAANSAATARGQRAASLVLTRCASSSPIPAAPRDLPGAVRDQHQRERQVDTTGGQIGGEPLRRRSTHQTHCRDAQSDEAEARPRRAKQRPAEMPAASTTREALRNSTGLTAAISTSGRLCAKKVATVTGESYGRTGDGHPQS